MDKEFAICIPTYERSDRLMGLGQHTLAYIGDSLNNNIFLFVRDKEEEAYLKVAEKYGVGLVTIPDSVDGIKGTRDEILRWAIGFDIDKLIMIDDDLRLDYKPNPKKYIRMVDGKYFNQMIYALMFHCEKDVPVVGITARQFSDSKITPYQVDTRIIQVFCLHVPTIKAEDIWFSQFDIPFMTDYAFVLTMLQKGHHNICLNKYCRDDNSQTPGGCSGVRTVELASKSAVRLSKMFPGIVTPYVKTTGTWDEPRVNVRISWKKAFKEKEN